MLILGVEDCLGDRGGALEAFCCSTFILFCWRCLGFTLCLWSLLCLVPVCYSRSCLCLFKVRMTAQAITICILICVLFIGGWWWLWYRLTSKRLAHRRDCAIQVLQVMLTGRVFFIARWLALHDCFGTIIVITRDRLAEAAFVCRPLHKLGIVYRLHVHALGCWLWTDDFLVNSGSYRRPNSIWVFTQSTCILLLLSFVPSLLILLGAHTWERRFFALYIYILGDFLFLSYAACYCNVVLLLNGRWIISNLSLGTASCL